MVARHESPCPTCFRELRCDVCKVRCACALRRETSRFDCGEPWPRQFWRFQVRACVWLLRVLPWVFASVLVLSLLAAAFFP